MLDSGKRVVDSGVAREESFIYCDRLKAEELLSCCNLLAGQTRNSIQQTLPFATVNNYTTVPADYNPERDCGF